MEGRVMVGLVVVLLIGILVGYFILGALFKEDREDDEEINGFLEYMEIEGIELEIELPNTTFQLDDYINVTITLRNTNESRVFLEIFVLGGNTFFNITNSTGDRITEWWIDEYGARWETLEHDETYSDTIAVQFLYRIPQPGVYKIVGMYHSIVGSSDDYLFGVSLTSNEVTFEVV